MLRNAAAKLLKYSQANAALTFSRPKSLGGTHKLNGLEKKFMVWTGKFKKVEEVPDTLPPDIVERARNRMRIRIANYMMAATLLGCLAMVISGKRAKKRGESVSQMNIEWHKELEEERKREKEAAG